MLLWLFSITLVSVFAEINRRPMIGIVAKPDNDTHPTLAYLPAQYGTWLAQAGARIVPIRYDERPDRIKELFNSVNGLLFTGGDLTLREDTKYFSTANLLWQMAKEANDKGDYFPVWGTCMGFQLLSILAAEDHEVLLEYAYDSYNLPLPLNFTPNAHTSRMFGQMSPEILRTLTTKPATQNLHHDGILPETYTKNAKLAQTFVLLSTNTDKRGKPFASTIEGRKYPFYATQWHPERNQFAWGVDEKLDRSPDVIRAIQYVASFFVEETKKKFS